MIALEAGLLTVLNADSGAGGVATLATGGVYQGKVPQGTMPPYVIFKEAGDVPGYAFGNVNQFNHLFYAFLAFAVDANTSGVFQAGTIADRLKTLLTNPSLSVSGKSVLSARYDRSSTPSEDWDAANNRYIYSRGILCEVWVA